MTRPRCTPATAGSGPPRPARPRVGGRARAGLLLALLALCAAARPAAGQVFLASRPHPDFTVGPLLITATVQPDLGPVAVRMTWSLTLAPHVRPDDVRQDLYLLWPAEAVSGPPESADPALVGYVEERGFVVIGAGRLPLAVRDRAKLGTGAANDPLPDSAPFVTIYKRGRCPAKPRSARSSASRGRRSSSIRTR